VPSNDPRFDYTYSPAYEPTPRFSPTVVSQVTNLGTVYPTMTSGVTYSLASGNADPDTVAAAAAGDNESQAKRQRRAPGERVEKPDITFGQFDARASSGEMPVIIGVGGTAISFSAKEWRDMSRRRRRQVYKMARSDDKYKKKKNRQGGFGVLGDIASGLNPEDIIPGVASAKNLAKGDFVGAVATAIPGAALAQNIGANVGGAALSGVSQGLEAAHLGEVTDAVSTVTMPAVRGAMVGLNAPYEFGQGAFRDTVSKIGEQGYLGALAGGHSDPVGGAQSAGEQSVAGQAIKAIANGDSVEIGSGFLPAQAYKRTHKVNGVEVPVTKETKGATLVPGTKDQYQIPNPEGATVLAAQEEQEERGLIGGHVITPGRWVANTILMLEPDTQPFDVMSGLVDAGVIFYADPADKFLKASSALRRQAKTFKAADEGAALASKFKTAGGIIGKRGRKADRLVKDVSQAQTADDVQRIIPGLSDSHAEALARMENEDNIVDVLTTVERKGEDVEDWADRVARDVDAGRESAPFAEAQEGLNIGEQTAVLEAAGGVKTYRKFFDPITSREWFASKMGRKVVQHIADTDSPTDIIDFLGKNFPIVDKTGKRIIVNELADAETPADVMRVLDDVLGVKVTGMDTFGPGPMGLGYSFRKGMKDVRWFGMVPGSVLDFDDIPDAVKTLQRRMQNAKVDPQRQKEIIDNYLRNPSMKPNRYNTIDALMDAEKEQLLKYGVDPKVADEMTTAFRDSLEHERWYAVNQASDGPVYTPGMLDPETGELINAADTPLAMGEFLNSKVSLPNYRDIKQSTAYWNQIFNTPGVAKSQTLLDAYMGIWRKGKLARPAWGVRVVGEEQLRMAAVGLASIGRHPISALAWALGNPDEHFIKFLGKHGAEGAAGALTRAKVKYGKGMLDFEGGVLDDTTYTSSLNRRWSALLGDDTAKYYGKSFLRVDRQHNEFARGLVEHMSRLNDPIFRRAYDADTPDAAKAWFREATTEEGTRYRDILAQEPKLAQMADDDEFADAYMDFVYTRINDELSGGVPELEEAFRTLKFNDVKLVDQHGRATDEGVKEMQNFLNANMDIGPQFTKVQKRYFDTETQLQGKAKAFDQVLSSLFSGLMARPSDYLSRSPTFRQFYWQRGEELMVHANADARAKMIQTARLANIDMKTIRRMEEIRPVSTRDADLLTIKQMDTIAKAHALDGTKKLLYDLSEKSQFFDSARLIFPFGEAWKEVLTRWAGITYRNPEVIRRGQQAIQGARGAGWFYTDPQTGQEVFAFGASDLLAKAGLPAPPMPFVGSVSGLNLVSSGLPGVGPVVQIPMSRIIPDTPEYQELTDLILPYGKPDSTGNPLLDVAQEAAPLPSWANKLVQLAADPEMNRIYGNRVSHMMNYLASTGEYDLSKSKDLERLYNDAKSQARDQSAWSVVFSLFAPSAPITDWQVEDKKGRHTNAFAVADDFYERIKPEVEAQGGDWDDAMDEFFQQYGEDNILLLQPMSTKEGGYLPAEDKAFDWVRKNPDLRNDEPDVYGLFAPQGGAFAISGYNHLLSTGEIEKLTPRERLREAQNRIAGHIYRNKKDQIDPADDGQREWLREWQSYLEDKFPGWKPNNFNVGEVDILVRGVERAVENPKFAKASPGLVRTAKAYLAKRQEALEAADGVDLSGARDAEKRAWLREWGTYYLSRNEDFSEMWNEVFLRELGDN
jgi:hypothetical protein